MSHVLKFQQNGVDVIDIGAGFAGGNPYALVEYNPVTPTSDAQTGEYDLVSDVLDTMVISVSGTSPDNLVNNLNALEQLLQEAQYYKEDENYPKGIVELVFALQGGTNTVRVQVCGGKVESSKKFLGASTLSNYIDEIPIRVLRRPAWRGTKETLALTTSPSDNDANNFAALPSVKGSLPALAIVRVTASGGNSANANRVLLALRANRTPANFTHTLQAENYTARDTAVANLSDTNLSPGGAGVTGQRYTPTDTTFKMILRWEVTANVDDQKGKFIPVAFVRDNSSVPNYLLQFRAGIKLSSGVFQFPPQYATFDKVKTKFVNGTTEIGALELGQFTNPAYGGTKITPTAIVYELWAKALSTSSTSLDVDMVKFFPIGEARKGRGMIAAEFPQGIGANRVYFDAQEEYDIAYMTNGSDALLCGANNVPDGAPMWIPAQQAGFRLYGLLTRDAANGAKYDRTTTLNMSIDVIPLYVKLRGTN